MKANQEYDKALKRAVVLFALLLVVLVLPLLLSMQASADVIHEERSLYRDITVVQDGPRRCLIFNVRRGDRNQTCVDVDEPEKLVFTYTRMSFAGLLLQPQPKKILVAGLGGGSIPMTLTDMFPDALIDVVEIDRAVANVARDYFFFEENDNMKVTIMDARVFVKRAALDDTQYDYIVLDAFTGDYIPEHLLTREFLQEVQQIMSPDGVLVANTFSTSVFYDHESVTYQDVFGQLFNFKMPASGNRIIITSLLPLPERGDMMIRARQYADQLDKYDVPIIEYPARLTTEVDWDVSRKVLTDQFSPANLLRDN